MHLSHSVIDNLVASLREKKYSLLTFKQITCIQIQIVYHLLLGWSSTFQVKCLINWNHQCNMNLVNMILAGTHGILIDIFSQVRPCQ